LDASVGYGPGKGGTDGASEELLCREGILTFRFIGSARSPILYVVPVWERHCAHHQGYTHQITVYN